MSPQPWGRLLGLAPAEVPRLLLLEGTWWREERTRERLALLEGVRALPFPDMWLGFWHDQPVVYMCAYGAVRAVEPVHIFGELGCPAVVQIGSCGALVPALRTGDVVVPASATVGEATSRHYGPARVARPDPDLAGAIRRQLTNEGCTVHATAHVTTSALLAEPPGLVAAWRAGGHASVDLEASAVLTAAARFGMAGAAAMYVWDEVDRGRSWLDPFPPAEAAAQARAQAALAPAALRAALAAPPSWPPRRADPVVPS